MKKLILLAATLLIFFSAGAQWAQVKNAQVSASEYEEIIYTGTSVIAASEGGIFRSADNGNTWNISVNGLDTNRIESWDMTWLQARSELWVTGNGIFKSSDDGVTWARASLTGLSSSNSWPQGISHVGSRLIILHHEWDNGLSTNIYKLCYSDNGTTWSYGATLGPESTSRWNLLRSDNNYAVYLIEEPNDGSSAKLWYSANGTTHVLHPVTGLGTDPRIRDNAFSIDPAGTSLFFADEKSSKFYKYNPAITSWEEKMNGIGGGGLTVAGVLSINNLGAHLFGTAILSNVSMELSLKLFYSSDQGANWTAIDNPGLAFPIFEDQMIIAGSNRIIGNCFNAHIAYSDNTGQTWIKVYEFFGGEFRSLAPLAGGAIFTYTEDQEQGIIKTTDNGNTWTVQNGDLPSFMGLHLIDGLFSVGSVLYAVAAEDPFAEKLYLYKSSNEGVNYTKITTGPDTDNKLFAGRHGMYPIVFFTDDGSSGTYQYTPDNGSTWVNISTGITPLGVDRVQGIKSNGTNMILFAEKSGRTHVYLSTNNGGTFSEITYELSSLNLEIIIANRWEWRALPNAAAAYKADGSEFFVAVKNYSSYPWTIEFYKLKPSNDGWVKIGSLGVPLGDNLNCHSLRHTGNAWYLVTSVGVYASADNMVSWLRVWNNQGFQKGVKPASVIINNDYIMLGTNGTGLWRAPLSAPSLTTLTVTEILDISATGGATIESTGGLPFLNKGLCWATHTSPTTSDNVLFKGTSWASFTGSMQPLLASTTYYVRAFVQGPKGITYGNEVSFTTTTATDIEPETVTGKVLIYPNPVKDVLNIRSGEEYQMSLFDVIGRNVLNSPVYNGTTSFLVDKLPAGLYFMKLKGTGGVVQTIRIIIK